MIEVNPDKPCPFCSNATIQTTVDDGYHWSSCPKCSATGPTEFLRSDEDSPGWNTRPDYDAAKSELSALREELAKLKEVINFKDAVACVFDMLRYTACNTSDKSWDDQLEDLADDVIEFAPDYKKQWKDIGELSSRLAAAEQRNAELVELLKRGEPVIRGRDIYGAKQLANEILAALKPTESGESE